MSGAPTVILASFDAERHSASYRFEEFVEAVTALTPAEAVPALRRVEAAVAGGLHAAGFVSYEAAPGLDETLTTREPVPDTPLERGAPLAGLVAGWHVLLAFGEPGRKAEIGIAHV